MQHSVLFVCLGNICRSPLAEGVFRAEVARRGLDGEIEIDSCGTSGWHVGESPDRRGQQTARRHGVDISDQVARQLDRDDLARFEWIVAMDADNHRTIVSRLSREPGGGTGGPPHIVRFMDYVPGAKSSDVPDPYYGGPDGFEVVYDLLERGAGRLLDAVLAGRR